MLRGLVIFLLLVGVGVQALPLHACAVEQVLAGRSCHDSDLAVAEGAGLGRSLDCPLGGHVETSGESGPTCRCELPKGGLDRHVPLDAPVDLLPALAAAPNPCLAIASHVLVPVESQPPDAAAAGVTLPLLI